MAGQVYFRPSPAELFAQRRSAAPHGRCSRACRHQASPAGERRGARHDLLIELAELEVRPGRLIGRPSTLRPFVCEGSPLLCRALLVGANPATKLHEHDFRSLWRPGYGFDKERWVRSYQEQRRARGKRPSSSTRRVLDRISTRASVACLETNTFATPTAALAELKRLERVTEPIDLLLLAVQPKAIVTYGADARRQIAQKLNSERELPLRRFVHRSAPWGDVAVRAEPHFFRAYSYRAADDVADALLAVAPE